MEKIKSVDRALEILEILTSYPSGIGVTELSNKLNVAKSTTHRLLTTLQYRNFVMKDPITDNYKLGTQILYLSNFILEHNNIRDISKEFLREIADITNETVHLCTYDNGEVVYIDKVEGNHTIRMHSRIGKRGLMHSTGVGKAILAYMDEHKIKDILKEKGMESFTPNTITNQEDLFVELSKIRDKGYAIDNIENELGIRCVAAPIFNYNMSPVAAISISGPENRITHERIENELKDIVKNAAKEISNKLGARDK